MIYIIEGDDWIQKKIILVFWNNNYISRLCENWAFYNNNYVYISFEELCTFPGEAIYTTEHKATLSKEKHM